MTGIDISHYQDGLDLKRLRDGGYTFAILKISEGRALADSSFDKFYDMAQAANIPVGAYVYSHATSAVIAQEEATFAVSRLKGRPLQLGIFMDIETTNQMQITKSQLKETALAFKAVVNQAGYKFGIYGSEYQTWTRLSVDDFAADSLIWVAHYGQAPVIYCDLWQMTDKGSFPSWYGCVDTDHVMSERFSDLVKPEEKQEDKPPVKEFPPDPSVAIFQMVMKFNDGGYWDYPIDGKKSKLFFEKLEEFVEDMKKC